MLWLTGRTYDKIRKIATGQGVDYTIYWIMLYQKLLYIDSNRFKQTTGTWCCFKSNVAN